MQHIEMHIKFVTFVFISTFLIAGIYSSSVSKVFAESFASGTIICADGTTDSTVAYCTSTKLKTVYACEKDKNGKYTKCTQLKVHSIDETPSLNDALDAAIQEQTQDTPKVPDNDTGNDAKNECCCGDPGAPPCPKGSKDLGGFNDDESGPQLNPGE